jgi:mannosyltransferase OCH1-like enzyme
MDMKCLKSINTIPKIQTCEFIGSYSVHDIKQHIGLILFGTMKVTNKVINNGVIMCVPKHDILLLTIKEAYEKRNYHSMFNNIHVFETTGPSCLTNAVKKYKVTHSISNDNVQILSSIYFESCHVINVNQNKCKISNNAIGIHLYENSWITTNETIVINVYTFLIKYWYMIIIIIIIFSIYYSSSVKKSLYKLYKLPKLRKLLP